MQTNVWKSVWKKVEAKIEIQIWILKNWKNRFGMKIDLDLDWKLRMKLDSDLDWKIRHWISDWKWNQYFEIEDGIEIEIETEINIFRLKFRLKMGLKFRLKLKSKFSYWIWDLKVGIEIQIEFKIQIQIEIEILTEIRIQICQLFLFFFSNSMNYVKSSIMNWRKYNSRKLLSNSFPTDLFHHNEKWQNWCTLSFFSKGCYLPWCLYLTFYTSKEK